MLRSCFIAVLLCFAAAAPGQLSPSTTASPGSQTTPGTGSSPGYTIDIGTRLVVEDVSVIDRHGHPVSGLPAAAFHVLDNGIAQRLRAFSEGTATRPAAEGEPSLPSGTYSNGNLYRDSGPVIAMLIDPVSMDLPGQMYLRLQMLHYLDAMPEGTSVVLFRANSRGVPVLVQSLTTDRKLLVTAINESIPTLPRPVGSLFSNGIAELGNISDYLRAVPGKKVLLWFAGQFPLYLDPNLCTVMGPMTPTIDSNATYSDCGSLNDALKAAFRDLAQARISVYPIDVRGVVVLGPPPAPAMPSSPPPITNSPGAVAPPDESAGSQLSSQYDLEDQLATATGGRAFHSNNGLADGMSAAVSLGEHAYTLAYQPEPYKVDGRWHKVRISVDGPYSVRYRTGYYAAESTPRPARPLLTATGTTFSSPKPAGTELEAEPGQDAPIIFTAHVQPQGKLGKSSQFLVEYNVPTSQLAFKIGPAGDAHARFRLAVLPYNTEGDVETPTMETVETRFTPAQMIAANRMGTPAVQAIQVHKGAQFLLLAVEDLGTQRVGTLQIPLGDLER